jgi:hypothetical protein
MKHYKKIYLISILGCAPLLGRTNPPTNTKQAQALVATAQTSTDISKVQEIHRALQSVKTKFPNQLNKVNRRLKELQAAQPKPAVSPADQNLVTQLQKQLNEKQTELEAAQTTCMQASQDQTTTIARLQHEVEQLKTQLQTCQIRTTPPPLPPAAKGPPGPPPDASKVKGPPVPPPDIPTRKTPPKERTGLLEEIRAGKALKKPSAPPSKKVSAETNDTLLDIIEKRRKALAPDDDNNDDEYEDWV